MKIIPLNISIIILAGFICTGCALQPKNGLEIRANGFLHDNYYQAILEIEPDDGAKGLVAKRDSAYFKAKNARLGDMAAENIAQFCIDRGIQEGIIDRTKKDMNVAELKNNLINRVKPLSRGGRIAFTYYNDKNILVIGYRIFNVGFKKKIDDIVKSLEINQGITPTTRS